jgi:hypothetical protein
MLLHFVLGPLKYKLVNVYWDPLEREVRVNMYFSKRHSNGEAIHELPPGKGTNLR